MVQDENRLYEFTGIPFHKSLEFFIPPVMRSSFYLAAKFFDRNQEFYSKLKIESQEIAVKKNENYEIRTGAQYEDSSEYSKEEDTESTINYIDMEKLKSNEDYLLFISNYNKKVNKEQNYKYSYSSEKKKEISKYFKGVHIEYLKHNDIASMLRAFLGAVYNCFGTSAASKIMKKFNLISDE